MFRRSGPLFIIPFLHQTTTIPGHKRATILLFIIPFLHQTTTQLFCSKIHNGCSLFLFYIKPQLRRWSPFHRQVVHYSFSTSNHNSYLRDIGNNSVVHYSFSTSNHNCEGKRVAGAGVVHYSFSTSNHNCWALAMSILRLFIIPFLHQTTTLRNYRSYPSLLFIIPFLHQTTTGTVRLPIQSSCSLFLFYIKPQPQLVFPLKIKELQA